MGAALQDKGSVLVVGHIFCDLVFTGLTQLPKLGEEHLAKELTVTAGGGVFITSARLAAQGVPVRIVCDVGTDMFSGEVLRQLERAGIDTSLVVRHNEDLPQVTVAMPLGDDRAFLTRAKKPAKLVDKAGVVANNPASHLHVCAMQILRDNPAIIAAAKANGMTVSADPMWLPEFLSSPAFWDVAKQIDLITPNDAEASVAAGGLTGAALDSHLAAFAAEHSTDVLLTRGPYGATLFTGNRRFDQKAVTVDVVDTTGAGDSLNAGYLARKLAGADAQSCLKTGVACGLLCVQHAGGATQLHSAEEIEKWAAKLP